MHCCTPMLEPSETGPYRWASGSSSSCFESEVRLPPQGQQGLLEPQFSLPQLTAAGAYPLAAAPPSSSCAGSLQNCLSLPQDAFAAPPHSAPLEALGFEPALAAAANALARARRAQQLHGGGGSTGGSMSFSACSSASYSQPLPAAKQYGRLHSITGTGPTPMDVCPSSSRPAGPYVYSEAPRRQASPTQLDLQAQARLGPQEEVLLSQLKHIMGEKQQLAQLEQQLRHKLEEEADRALGSPHSAAQACCVQQRSSSFSSAASRGPVHTSSRTSPTAAAAAAAAIASAAAAGPCSGSSSSSPHHRGNASTAAALLAAHADPAVVTEYLKAHRQQQQQHQVCMAAVAAAVGAAGGAASSRVQKHPCGLPPPAMSKLRQLMALQQQQIQVQQELLMLLAQQ